MVTINFSTIPNQKGKDWALYKGIAQDNISSQPDLVIYKAEVYDGYRVNTRLSANYREIKSWIKKMRTH